MVRVGFGGMVVSRPAVDGVALAGLASVRPWRGLRSLPLLLSMVLEGGEGRCLRGLEGPVADGWALCLLVGGECGCERREEPLGTP